MSDVKRRNPIVDLMKSLGILCMVAGHCGVSFSHFVYLFHMAVFFMLSGYCYKSYNSKDFTYLSHYIKRKVFVLWFPYVMWTTIYSLLHNLFIRIYIYTDDPLILEYVSGAYVSPTEYWSWLDILKNIIKAIFLHGETQIGGALWFLATLLEISIIYGIIDFVINIICNSSDVKKIMSQWLISCAFLSIGFMCHKLTSYAFGFDKVFSYYILFHIGHTIKKYGLSEKCRTINLHFLVLVGTFVVLVICNNFGSIALDQNKYENPLFFLLVSYTGWQLLYELSYFIEKTCLLKPVLITIGQNTLSIVALHFLSFKLVNYIGVLFYHQPLCLIATFPVLYRMGVWPIAYLIIGICVPVLLSLLWKRILKIF